VATMAREPVPALKPGAPGDEPPPAMFDRPTDVTDPLPPVRGSEHVASLHAAWGRMAASEAVPETSAWRRVGRKARSLADRGLGRPDREVMANLIRAVDAVAARCDELLERLTSQQVSIDDMATIYGEELTRMRAELARVASRARPPADDG